MKILFTLLVIFCSGCSLITGEPLTPGAKLTASRIAVNYLSTVVYGREEKLADYIAWSEFLGRGNEKISHAEFSRQLALFKQTFPPSDPKNPLIGLTLKDVRGSDSLATISFKKIPPAEGPEIWVKLVWSGSGWIVTEDSLFGKEKLFGQLFP